MNRMELAAENARAAARQAFPNKSDAWIDVWIQRAAQYLFNDGDMTGAPDFPEEA